MNNLPVFSRMVKAIGDHVRPAETAFRYDTIEFRKNGTFVRHLAVDIDDLIMRADKDRLFEMGSGSERQLISAAEFYQLKAAWDIIRVEMGYSPVDEFGNDVN